ncbi:transmembrane protein 275 [Astyanax mexicanus]|uniref:Transmembrane protein 275 n=3 Tax=Astyanax mexicanus TaxID=7994 RepID=A0A8T2L9J3_ASTMX|nr:transmembrane protein 275 [Astyanax mexicanus]
MICSDKGPHMAPVNKPGQRKLMRMQGHPSPALCCACGLCIMLAGINITLVGAFGFSKMLPFNNPPIIIGPLLLLVALSFFGVCCVCSRQPAANTSRKANGQNHWGLMRATGTAFEMEASEHTLQDTTAIQLSPTNSPCSSAHSSPAHSPAVMHDPPQTTDLANDSHFSCHSPSIGDDTSPLSPSHDDT